MPKRSTGTTFTAGRTFGLDGTTYQVGQAIPGTALRGIKRLSALIGRGFIIPNQDVYGRTRPLKRARRDRTFNPAERRSL